MELRCGKCGHLLAKGKGTLEIKCDKCKCINQFDTERQGAPVIRR